MHNNQNNKVTNETEKIGGFKVVDRQLVKDQRSYKILFQTIVGSVAYGTNVEGSDVDIKGVFVQPLADQLLHGRIKEIKIDNDTTYYELQKFIDLCALTNPTMTELMWMPERCIQYIDPLFKSTFYNDEIRSKFLTGHARNSFCGYAYQQIKKASGLNKLMNFEKDGHFSKSKDVLDFCYVITDRSGWTVSLKNHLKELHEERSDQSNYVLSKAKNMVQTYFAYFDPEAKIVRHAGMIGDDSNQLRTSTVPMNEKYDFIVQFNHGAFKEHSKKHKQYKTWMKERNTQRYVDSQTHGQKVDGKNLLHCIRLIDMGREIVETGRLNVERPNAKELIDIRKGRVDLNELLKSAEIQLREVEDLFRASGMPKNVPPSLIRKIKRTFYL